MPQFTIRDTIITPHSGPYVVAELSHSHNGSVDMAHYMITVAAACGAHAVKLQKRSPMFYDALHAKGLHDYATLRESRELAPGDYATLRKQSHALGLAFVATAFDEWALDFITQCGVDAVKIASGTIRNLPLITAAAKTKLPLILSTGCADLGHVGCAVATANVYHDNICLLQCTSEYPCKPEHMALRVIPEYSAYHVITGLSSHSPDNRLEPVAFALGARVFEKHFTLSKHLGAGDHAMSLDPDGLKDLVDVLTASKLALGDGRKQFLPCEEVGRTRLDIGYTPVKETA